MKYYRTGWISDVHLGTRGSNAVRLLNFLRETEFETLYIVGDLIDIWALRRVIYWPQEHNDVLQKLLRKGRKGTEIIYIVGNHDEFLESFLGKYGSITLEKNAVHLTADRRRLLVMHGDELDAVVQNIGWLAHLGDLGYRLLMRCNGLVNVCRRMLGLGNWSLSAYVKAEVKNVVTFISGFEEAVVRYAQDFGVDGVLCGHIHTATIREIHGIVYYNSGDWVESCTAIVEGYDGSMELLRLDENGTSEPSRSEDGFGADARPEDVERRSIGELPDAVRKIIEKQQPQFYGSDTANPCHNGNISGESDRISHKRSRNSPDSSVWAKGAPGTKSKNSDRRSR